MSQLAAIWANADVQFVTWALLKIVIILHVMLGAVSYAIYAERKIAGHIQARTGPNRVGPLGLFQPLADVGKLFFKEEFTPDGANKVVFHIAPMLAVIPSLVTFSVIPFGPTDPFQVTNINVGLLLFLAMSSVAVYAITLGGWSSNNKYALLGGLRSSAQMISYELSMGLSTIPVLLMAGSLSLVDIVHSQTQRVLPFLPGWYVFTVPGFIAFVIFMITALAETNRAPFDLPEAESELVAGFHTEYSSMKWALFFLGEYAAVFAISSVAIVLFLGGWDGPFLPPNLQFVWFLAKLSVLVFFFIWVRWTFPRLRYDQLMHLGWKVLLPISVLNLAGTAVWQYIWNNR
jgi:NADH-quinone oxidoreductase subunit H